MSDHEIVRAALRDISEVIQEPDGVRVTTHCLYPTGAFVQVVVRGGVDAFVVSDEGGAVRQIENAGADVRNIDKLISGLVVAHGLEIRKGVISAPQCNRASLALAIALVANVAKDVADWLFAHVKVQRHRKFKATVAELVRTSYRVRSDVIVGESNKSHKFDNIIIVNQEKRIVVDAVAHDPNSIAARVVANMDVRNRHYPGLEQRIVYDDTDDEWRPEDLALLQIGAPVIAFSNADRVIGRLATLN